MKSDKTRMDVKRNCAFHKDIWHNTKSCVALKDEIERLIRVRHFKEFIDQPQVTNRDERPQQRSPEKVREVLIIIGGSHLVRKNPGARDKYANDAKTPPPTQVYRTEKQPTKHA